MTSLVQAIQGAITGTTRAAAEVEKARPEMSDNLLMSKYLLKKGYYKTDHQKFFDALVAKMQPLNKAIAKLEKAGTNAGTCTITAPGIIYGIKKFERPMVEVNNEIQGNLKIVKADLEKSGVIKAAKASPLKASFVALCNSVASTLAICSAVV